LHARRCVDRPAGRLDTPGSLTQARFTTGKSFGRRYPDNPKGPVEDADIYWTTMAQHEDNTMQPTAFHNAARRVCRHVAAGAFILLVLAGGCAAPGLRGEVPLGNWTGEGTFVYQGWKEGESTGQPAAPTMAETIRREYPTTLAIRNGRLDNLDVIMIEIQSKRGSLPQIGDETRLNVALEKVKRVSDSTVLYREVAAQLNASPDDKLHIEKDTPPITAVCTTERGVTTFAIQYMENFTDVFRFDGGTVEKTGLYFDKETGLVHWCEQLKRR
jgi:hypothetical protein